MNIALADGGTRTPCQSLGRRRCDFWGYRVSVPQRRVTTHVPNFSFLTKKSRESYFVDGIRGAKNMLNEFKAKSIFRYSKNEEGENFCILYSNLIALFTNKLRLNVIEMCWHRYITPITRVT